MLFDKGVFKDTNEIEMLKVKQGAGSKYTEITGTTMVNFMCQYY